MSRPNATVASQSFSWNYLGIFHLLSDPDPKFAQTLQRKLARILLIERHFEGETIISCLSE